MALTALGLLSLVALLLALLTPGTAGFASSSSSRRSKTTMASLPSALVRQRAKAAILGAFVADAATMPLHWIYDQDQIKSLLEEEGLPTDQPEFFPKPACPFYQYKLGAMSPYGDEIVPLLRHLGAQGKAGFDSAGFGTESAGFFKAYGGRLSHVPKLFLEATEAGKRGQEAAVEDSQAHGIIKVPLLVARYAGSPQLLPQVEAAVRVHQKSQTSVAASLALARVLELIVLKGVSTQEAIKTILAASPPLPESERGILESALAAPYPRPETIKDFGWSCALPGALQGALYVAAHAPSYAAGVRFSCLAGGDNCSRNIVIGALLAAQDPAPAQAVPAEWAAKTAAYAEVEALADRVVAELE